MRLVHVLIPIALVAVAPAFSATIYGGKVLGTTTILHVGDRELTSLAFTGTADTFTGVDFLHFSDGFLYEPADGFNPQRLSGWNDPQNADFGGGNLHYFSPDRADNATPYAGEVNNPKTATLAEIFGPFGSYKNMNYTLDGEDGTYNYYVDLLFTPSFSITGDANPSSVEFAVLERGGNSDFNIYGILAPGTRNVGGTDYAVAPLLTPGIFLPRGQGQAVWQLDSLEVPKAQGVYAWGVSIDPTWRNLIGIRLEAPNSQTFGGPDLVAVGVRDIPEPGTFALFAAGAFALVAFRRRRAA